MKKVLLSLKNLTHDKLLFNFITLKYSGDLHIVGLSDNSSETISLISCYKPDIIFIDSASFLELNLDFIDIYPFYYIDDQAGLLNDYPYGLSYLHIFNNFDELFEGFKSRQSKALTRKMEAKLTKKLADLNFNFKQAGTRYFLEALIYVYENKYSNVLNNISNYVYPIVSNKFHTNPKKVKWNIEKSINYMYSFNTRYFPGLLEEYLDFEFTTKPTTKELIVLLLRLL